MFLSLLFLTINVSALETETLGEFKPTFNLTPNDFTVVVEVFNDPEIKGVSCYISTTKKANGTLAFETEMNETSFECTKSGSIKVPKNISRQLSLQNPAKQKTLFKKMKILRMHDKKDKI